VSTTDAKSALRRVVRERRAARSPHERAIAGEALARHADLLASRTVSAFVAVRDEPPTLPLIDRLRRRGSRVLLPLLRADDDLEWAEFAGRDELRPGRLGILEPTGASLGLDGIREAELVLAPALAVDARGRRLGQGGGSYDRALARARGAIVAVVFDDEVLDDVPTEPHDRRVAGVLAPEAGLRWFDDGAQR
jgi:5-formyltetrahydrofolate cyclo-ligase